jgi:hypothetical protein
LAGFGEDVCNLVLERNIRHVDFSYRSFSPENVKLNVNVLGASRKLRIIGQANVPLIVQQQKCGIQLWMSKTI